MIEHERHGLTADFFDGEGMADLAGRVLDDPAAFRPLGEVGVALVHERYRLDVCFPRFLGLLDEALNRPASVSRAEGV